MRRKNSLLAVSAAIVLLGPAVPTLSAQTDLYGTRNRPLEGRRYETMRALAHYLDEAAQDAFTTAVEEAREGAQGRRLLPLVRDFALRADEFHALMDNYQASRREVPPRVTDLITRARRVNSRWETTYIAPGTAGDWTDVMDVLTRMKKLMGGENVEVPMAHGNLEDYDRDYGMFGGVARAGGTGASAFDLTGYRLEEFRRLAHELDQDALRSHQIAETNRFNYSGRQEEFLSDLGRFAERAHDVHVRADEGRVDPRAMAPIVSRLLQDARETDRSLRDTRVFPEVWDQWGETIAVLSQMVDLVQ